MSGAVSSNGASGPTHGGTRTGFQGNERAQGHGHEPPHTQGQETQPAQARAEDAQAARSPEHRETHGVVASLVVPGMPHLLLVPEANEGYARLQAAYGEARKRIEALRPDLLLLYSTQWLSVIGHQVQARAAPEWVHVDQEWHELGSIPYRFRMDPVFGAAYVSAGKARGLEMRTVDYEGFPIDTGSIVALKLLDPDRRVPASIVSCNMYADRAETIVLGKAAADAIASYRVDDGEGGTRPARIVAVAVTALSSRVHTGIIPFDEDRIHSQKDDEWNRKYLEILQAGRLEDAAQLARSFSAQAQGDQRMKAIWWLNAVNGQHNRFTGDVLGYEAVYGAGAAVVALAPTPRATGQAEFDEDDAELYLGDRNVLGGANLFEAPDGVEMAREGKDIDAERLRRLAAGPDPAAVAASAATQQKDPHDHARAQPVGAHGERPANERPVRERVLHERTPHGDTVEREHAVRTGAAPPRGRADQALMASTAPRPVGAYPHARRVGGLLYLSGLGPRDPVTDEVPGGAVWDADGGRQEYDIRAQTEAVVRNMKTVLASAGATIDDVVDVTCYLIDMQRDFAGFNEVYAKHFGDVQATRTTLEIGRLPTPIAVEFKVVAKAPEDA